VLWKSAAFIRPSAGTSPMPLYPRQSDSIGSVTLLPVTSRFSAKLFHASDSRKRPPMSRVPLARTLSRRFFTPCPGCPFAGSGSFRKLSSFVK
jgi:hypothetical protein